MNPRADDHLEAVLRSIGQHLVIDSAGNSEYTEHRKRHPLHSESRGRTGRWLVAAAAAALVLAAIVVSPARRTVAGWFSIGQTDVVLVGTVDRGGLPELQEGATPITFDEAARRLGRPMPASDSSTLAAPAVIVAPPEGGVLLLWPRGSTTLWIQRAGLDGDALYDKLVDAGESVAPIPDLGDGGLSISGDHFLRTPQRLLAADTVVLWTGDGLEHRLESDLPVSDLVEIAHALDA